jgi:hypothetical protein
LAKKTLGTVSYLIQTILWLAKLPKSTLSTQFAEQTLVYPLRANAKKIRCALRNLLFNFITVSKIKVFCGFYEIILTFKVCCYGCPFSAKNKS